MPAFSGLMCCCGTGATPCPSTKIDFTDGTFGPLPNTGAAPWYANDAQFPAELVLRSDGAGELLWTKDVLDNNEHTRYRAEVELVSFPLSGGVTITNANWQATFTFATTDTEQRFELRFDREENSRFASKVWDGEPFQKLVLEVKTDKNCKDKTHVVGYADARPILSFSLLYDVSAVLPATVQMGVSAPGTTGNVEETFDPLGACCPQNDPPCYTRRVTMSGGFRDLDEFNQCVEATDVEMNHSTASRPDYQGVDIMDGAPGYNPAKGYYFGPAPFTMPGINSKYIFLWCNETSGWVEAWSADRVISSTGVESWGFDGWAWTPDSIINGTGGRPCQTGHTWSGDWGIPTEVCGYAGQGALKITFEHIFTQCEGPPRRFDNVKLIACAGKTPTPCPVPPYYECDNRFVDGEWLTTFVEGTTPKVWTVVVPSTYTPPPGVSGAGWDSIIPGTYYFAQTKAIREELIAEVDPSEGEGCADVYTVDPDAGATKNECTWYPLIYGLNGWRSFDSWENSEQANGYRCLCWGRGSMKIGTYYDPITDEYVIGIGLTFYCGTVCPGGVNHIYDELVWRQSTPLDGTAGYTLTSPMHGGTLAISGGGSFFNSHLTCSQPLGPGT